MRRTFLFVALLLCVITALAQPAPENKIMALGYLGFRDSAATEANFARLAEAGLDMITLEMDSAGAGMQLDLAAAAGMKVLAVLAPYTDRTLLEDVDFEKVDELVLRFKAHPALYGWHICDEPGIKRIPMLKAVKEHIEALDGAHPVYINLNPLGSINALGTDFYRDYIDTFVRECNFQLLSYDCYPTMQWGMVNWWYMCNEAVLEVTRRYAIPFWAFAATCWIDREGPLNMHEKPSLENVRLQINTNLAYGAQVMQYFTIRDFGGTSLAPFMNNSQWTEAYDVLKEANLEMKRREVVFAGCKVLATRFICQTPFGARPLLKGDLPAAISSVQSDRTALVSMLDNNGCEYVVVVSTSPSETTGVSVDFASGVDYIDRAGNTVSQSPGTKVFALDPGDMLVFRCL